MGKLAAKEEVGVMEKSLEKFLPTKKVGYLAVMPVVDTVAFEGYQLAPKNLMFVFVTMGIREFSLADVDRLFAPLEEYLAKLMDRRVDMIVHGGVPLSIIMGIERHEALLRRIEKATGLPATSTVQFVVEAAK